ncbi:MAG TPA: CpXC domain-containing protein [Acidobacteriota bacterium]|nr:CpXC domain-containing protein [Kiritimatiellia bacterium]HQG93256.1 CpXC domain-containing protein [Acidobacteriota bacterium]HQK87724.1 CpXC domain-containing protein [Acidobacteriota bacterium]
MTMCRDETARCPLCGKEQEFRIYPSVNVRLNPELREKILDLTLPDMLCQGCGETVRMYYDLLYHDSERNLAIYLAPPGGGADLDGQEAFGPEYTNRQVRNWWELAEKIRIFEAGQADYEVECAKIILAQVNGIGPDDRFYLLEFNQTDAGDTRAAFVWFSPQGPNSFSMDWTAFAKDYARHFEELKTMYASRDEWILLNRNTLLQDIRAEADSTGTRPPS